MTTPDALTCTYPGCGHKPEHHIEALNGDIACWYCEDACHPFVADITDVASAMTTERDAAVEEDAAALCATCGQGERALIHESPDRFATRHTFVLPQPEPVASTTERDAAPCAECGWASGTHSTVCKSGGFVVLERDAAVDEYINLTQAIGMALLLGGMPEAGTKETLAAFERAIEARTRREGREQDAAVDARLPEHMRATTLLAHWMARAEAAEAALVEWRILADATWKRAEQAEARLAEEVARRRAIIEAVFDITCNDCGRYLGDDDWSGCIECEPAHALLVTDRAEAVVADKEQADGG